MVGLKTDDAPAMVGCGKDLMALCRKDFYAISLPLHYSSAGIMWIFSKTINNVTKLVVKIVNKVRAQAL